MQEVLLRVLSGVSVFEGILYLADEALSLKALNFLVSWGRLMTVNELALFKTYFFLGDGLLRGMCRSTLVSALKLAEKVNLDFFACLIFLTLDLDACLAIWDSS